MKVIYVAGPFRAKTSWGVEQNIRQAEEAAFRVWGLGAAALCPHTNTRFFNGEYTDALWIAGTLELLHRCDAVLVVGQWMKSKGTIGEITAAQQWNIPTFYNLTKLAYWLEDNDYKIDL